MASTASADVKPDFESLRHSILRRIAPIVQAAGLTEHEVACQIDGHVQALTVTLRLPLIAGSVQRAVGVRVLDAVRADGRTFGSVSVTFDPVP